MKKILDDHRSLMLLDEISGGDELTQRDLSARLDMAVGLVNVYLKNLVTKGYIKVSGIPPKRFKYYLTPKGFKEKTRLTYDLLQNYTKIFREARRDYSKLFHELQRVGVRRVYFAGMDELAEIAYLSLKEAELEFVGVVDDGQAGGEFLKTEMLGFEGLDPEDSDHFVITSYISKDIMDERLEACGIPADRVHSIYK